VKPTGRPRSVLSAAALALVCACTSTPPPAWELPPPEPAERPVVRDGALTRLDLEHGLRVLVHEDHSLPRVSLSLVVRRGATVEGLDEAGVASYTAELLERGAGDRDALEFAEAVDALGARFGSGADWDSLSVSISGLSRDFEALVELLADAALRPRFDPREAERARDQRLAALERAKDDPATLARWHAARTVYDGHRYALPVSGDLESVARLDAAAARRFHARVMIPNDAILSVSGDVERDAAIAAAREHFGDWPRGEVADPGAPPPAQAPAARRIVVVDRPDLGQARIVVEHEGIARTDDERIAVSLMNTVLGGGGFSSRLMSSLRSDEGLTYGVGSGFSLRREPGPLTVSTFTRVEKVREALDLLLAELERARREPPNESELTWARSYAVGSFAMGLETSDAVTGALVDLDVYGLPEDSLDTYRARVRAVTQEEVAEAARAHLHPERAAIVLVGPADAIVPQLEGLGEVEVVEP
jgi:zinc protease